MTKAEIDREWENHRARFLKDFSYGLGIVEAMGPGMRKAQGENALAYHQTKQHWIGGMFSMASLLGVELPVEIGEYLMELFEESGQFRIDAAIGRMEEQERG